MEKNKLEIAIEKAQNLLKFFTETNFEGVKVVDSDSLVDYSTLEVGADVQVSTSTGSAPAPDGDYSLVNGVQFTVKDGKIASITSTGEAEPTEGKKDDEAMANKPVEGSPEEEATETPADEKAEAPAEDEAVKALTDRVAKLEDMINSIMESVNAVPSKEDMSAFQKELKTVGDAIQILAKTPTQLSADNRVEVKESQLEKYSRIAEAFKK